MIKTHGLTHAALTVRDLTRSVRFYRELFGMKIVYQDPRFVQLQTPGTRDVLVLEEGTRLAGKEGGIQHLGFRLKAAKDIAGVADAVRAAGGRVQSEGEFVPGEPYVFSVDPDGYVIEIWFEKPTAVDPKR